MLRVAVICIAFALAGIAASYGFRGREPAENLTRFGAVLATLAFASAIIERALDVGLSMTLGAEADVLDGKIRALKATPGDHQKELDELASKRMAHRDRTRRWALPIAVVAGVLVSAIGLRSLEPLFAPWGAGKETPASKAFAFVDVLVTGLLLAGGSDGIHWMVALYRDWVDRSRSTRS